MTIGLNNISINSIHNDHLGGDIVTDPNVVPPYGSLRDNLHIQDLADVPVYRLKGAEPLISPKPQVSMPRGIYGAMNNGGSRVTEDLTYMASFMNIHRGKPDRRQDGHYKINSVTGYTGKDPTSESRGDILFSTFYSDSSGMPGSLGFNTFIPITDNWELALATGDQATAHLVFQIGKLNSSLNEHCLFLVRAHSTDYLRGGSVDCCLEQFDQGQTAYDEQVSFSVSNARAVNYKALTIAQSIWLPNTNDSSTTGVSFYRTVIRAGS